MRAMERSSMDGARHTKARRHATTLRTIRAGSACANSLRVLPRRVSPALDPWPAPRTRHKSLLRRERRTLAPTHRRPATRRYRRPCRRTVLGPALRAARPIPPHHLPLDSAQTRQTDPANTRLRRPPHARSVRTHEPRTYHATAAHPDPGKPAARTEALLYDRRTASTRNTLAPHDSADLAPVAARLLALTHRPPRHDRPQNRPGPRHALGLTHPRPRVSRPLVPHPRIGTPRAKGQTAVRPSPSRRLSRDDTTRRRLRPALDRTPQAMARPTFPSPTRRRFHPAKPPARIPRHPSLAPHHRPETGIFRFPRHRQSSRRPRRFRDHHRTLHRPGSRGRTARRHTRATSRHH